MPRQTTGKRIRLNLAVTKTVHDRMVRLMKLGECESLTEVVRRALETYEAALIERTKR